MNIVRQSPLKMKPKIADPALQVCIFVSLGLCLAFLCSNHHAHIPNLENGKVYSVLLHAEGIIFFKKKIFL